MSDITEIFYEVDNFCIDFAQKFSLPDKKMKGLEKQGGNDV